MIFNSSPTQWIPLLVIIIVSITVHEFAHSFMAISLGDPTPRQDRRLSLNPLRHLDPVGFICLLMVGFGWAKPVRIDGRLLKKPRRDEILVALAGPVSNMLLAFLLTAVAVLVLRLHLLPSQATKAVFSVLLQATMMNIGLALFNMLPIPPLDGSHLITPFLAKYNPAVAATFFRYGSFALIAIIIIEIIMKIDIIPVGKLMWPITLGMFSLLGVS
jgi:Zn-dependent protease